MSTPSTGRIALLAGLFAVAVTAGLLVATGRRGGEGATGDGGLVVAYPPTSGDAVATSAGRTVTTGDLQQLADLVSQNQQRWWNDPVHKRELLDRFALERHFVGEARRKGLHEDPRVRARMAYAAESVLIEALMTAEREAGVDDVKARAWFQDHAGEFGDPKLTLTLVAFPGEDAARSALAELEAGATLESLVPRSIDEATRGTHGRLGPVAASSLPGALQGPARSLPPGRIGPPVVDGERTWIVRVEERTGTPFFEDVAPSVRLRLQADVQRDFVRRSRESLGIVVDEEALSRFEVR
ncbi:peptidyl-prolyl cis-trans isomerase [Myxococcota bacterium]|nr:peptidyl-prolyl cis-trans isomerase [Myxococcota bacterium]